MILIKINDRFSFIVVVWINIADDYYKAYVTPEMILDDNKIPRSISVRKSVCAFRSVAL